MASEVISTKTGTDDQPLLDELPTAVVAPHILAIWGFNSADKNPWLLFRANTPKPNEVARSLVIVVDLSGSMNDHLSEARVALGELIRNSNAEGRVVIPTPSGMSAYVKTCMFLEPYVLGCDVVFLGDGFENCQTTPLTILSPQGTESLTLDFSGVSGDDYYKLVATYIVHVCKHKIFYVGIGSDARAMANSLVTRANCYVALVNRGASTREIVGVVRAVHTAPTQRTLGLTPSEPGIIVNISPEAQKCIDKLTEAELQAVVAAGNSIVVLKETTPPISDIELMRIFEDGEAKNASWFPICDRKKVRAAVLLSIAGMCTGDIPAAYFSGQRSGILTVDPVLKHILNKFFSVLKGKGVLKVVRTTPADGDGLPIIVEGTKMPPKSIIYKCLVPIEAIKACMENPEFAAPQSSLKKRARSEK
tara:strand:- start:226 stop:1485 length:1260 start_codon:yes stop_codon:yes gene_type:complete